MVSLNSTVWNEYLFDFLLQTLHVTVNMRSPTIVIPEYGSLHRDGSMLVIDLGQWADDSRTTAPFKRHMYQMLPRLCRTQPTYFHKQGGTSR